MDNFSWLSRESKYPQNPEDPVKRFLKIIIMNPFQKYWLIIFIFLLIMACGDDERITAFTKVSLVPMTEEKIVENQTVLVKGDRIFKIGPSNEIKIPPNARVIDGQGAYLMPGLADMHVHLKGDWPISQLDLYLANGVTTVRDLDGRDFMLQWRDEIKAGKRSGPNHIRFGSNDSRVREKSSRTRTKTQIRI